MATDINLLGKRYPELNPTQIILNDSLLAIYKTGEPELNKITFQYLKKAIKIADLADLDGVIFVDRGILRWSTATSKFEFGAITLADIPDLDASKITTGIFNVLRIPDLSIAKITNLQTALDGKEPVFDKGNVNSSTLTVTGNVGRLYGADSLNIDFDVATISPLFLPANQTISFISSDQTITINGLFDHTQQVNSITKLNLQMAVAPYVHPTGFGNLPSAGALAGADVISQLWITSEGHVGNIVVRALTKADIGLGNVDNTSDLAKPISTATQTAINNLDARFLRKDIADNNGTNRLTLGSLTVNTEVVLAGILAGAAADEVVTINATGVIRKTAINTLISADITNLQNQIDAKVSDKNWVHEQATLSDTWTVNHNLNKECSITVYDSSWSTVRFSIDETLSSLTTTVLKFLTPIQGKAIFN